MNRASRIRPLWLSGPVLLALWALGSACSSTKDTEAYVPSQRGAVQPDAGGPLISEASACNQVQSAEAAARASLGCPAVKLACPGAIRPAGGEACFEYSQGSVDGCAALFDSFKSCDDFALHPCLISALSVCDSAGEGGAGGAAGGPGAAGAAGEAGSAGASGQSEGGSGGS